jgi:uncharacterized protein YyaL (SSP411 family)
VRLEVVDRQLVQHVLVVAQIVFTICAAPAFAATWGDPALARQGKPVLAAVGYPSAHEWRVVEHPSFVTVAIDRDVYPHIAEAYRRFASIAGVTGEPVYVVMTPHLEPVAAHGREGLPTFLDEISRRWGTEREQLVAEAGLAVRRYLLEKHDTARVETSPLQQVLQSPRFDVVGGSFFRTETSFDKSLDDQVRFALEALATGQHEVARSTLDYVVAELQDRSGVFFAAQRADSLVPRGGPVMIEGGHYMWERSEVEQILGSPLADIFAFHYLLNSEGRSVPRLARPTAETRARFSLSEQELQDALRSARQKLFDVRSKRPDPMPHMIVVTESNALTISALARTSMHLGEPRYLDAATRGMRALLKQNRRNGRLFRADNVGALPEDYAALTHALMDLYSATFDPSYISTALEVRTDWLARPPGGDLPEPVAALFAPPRVTPDPRLDAIAGGSPGQRQIIVSGEAWRDETKLLLQAARMKLDDNTMVFYVGSNRTRAQLAAWMPHAREVGVGDKQPVAALCQQRTCSTPTTDPAIVTAW